MNLQASARISVGRRGAPAKSMLASATSSFTAATIVQVDLDLVDVAVVLVGDLLRDVCVGYLVHILRGHIQTDHEYETQVSLTP